MTTDDLRERIVDTALELAAEDGWERVRLFQVADRLGLELLDIHAHFAEKEAIVDAVLDRADRVMLAEARRWHPGGVPAVAGSDPDVAVTRPSPRQTLQHLVMTWLQVLQPWRPVVREMILGKLEPGHLHVQLPALLRISRTVQWLREAAGLEGAWTRRALEESVLTSIFVTTFLSWLGDGSPSSRRTRRRLDLALSGAERGARWLNRLGPGRSAPRQRSSETRTSTLAAS